MEKKSLNYFERIAKIQTPSQKQEQYDCFYMEMCGNYCKIRNTAREVLRGELLSDVGKKEIKGLLKKIEKLSKNFKKGLKEIK